MKNQKVNSSLIKKAYFLTGALLAQFTANYATAAGSSRSWINDSFVADRSWEVKKHPRMMRDMNGDGRADIIGFANVGVHVSLAQGSHFSKMQQWSSGFSLQQEYMNSEENPRYVVDVDNDGCNDILGFGPEGVEVKLFNKTSDQPLTCEPSQQDLKLFPNFGSQSSSEPRFVAHLNDDDCIDLIYFSPTEIKTALNWCDGTGEFENVPGHLKSFRTAPSNQRIQQGELVWDFKVHKVLLADINGDKLDDIVGFHDIGVYVSYALGDGAFSELTLGEPANIDSFGIDDGWVVGRNDRLLIDVNNDGMHDIVGFANSIVVVSLANGNGFNDYVQVSDEFGAYSWDETTYRTLVDFNNDGCIDLAGINGTGVIVDYAVPDINGDCTGLDFSSAKRVAHVFGSGWTADQHLRLFADLNNDGRPDLVGFHNSKIYVSMNIEMNVNGEKVDYLY
ncbi:hypothetical protein [Aliikangiella sp. IMCC44632]